jgi:elongator complex protein 1
MPEADIRTLARELAETLEEAKEFRSAATIRLDYLNDIEQGARLLCKAYQYSDAIRLVALKGQSNLLQTVIDRGLVDGFNTVSELLADCKAQIGAQVPRLRELRVKKEQEPRKSTEKVAVMNLILYSCVFHRRPVSRRRW